VARAGLCEKKHDSAAAAVDTLAPTAIDCQFLWLTWRHSPGFSAHGRQRKLLPSPKLRLKAPASRLWPNKRPRAVPVTTPSDDRSPAAKAYQWASRIMIVALEMVLPGLAGYWVDKRLGTVVFFTLIGFAAGSTGAVIHLVRMTREDQARTRD